MIAAEAVVGPPFLMYVALANRLGTVCWCVHRRPPDAEYADSGLPVRRIDSVYELVRARTAPLKRKVVIQLGPVSDANRVIAATTRALTPVSSVG
jgi:hypothetical protein